MRTGRKMWWAVCFMSAVLLSNLHLLTGVQPTSFLFETSSVLKGEWWRIFTHPFVHVSWYHLILDSAAILLLWRELYHLSRLEKLLVSLACGAMSLIFAICFSPHIHQYGLCGFSGVAHGLTVFLGWSWLCAAMRDNPAHRRWLTAAGLTLTLATIIKSILEMISGSVVFSSLHIGELGIPIVEAHLGGVAGGCLAFCLFYLSNRKSFDLRTKMTDKLNRDGMNISNNSATAIHG